MILPCFEFDSLALVPSFLAALTLHEFNTSLFMPMEVDSHLFLAVLRHILWAFRAELNLNIYKSLVFFYPTDVMVKVNCDQWLHVENKNSYLEKILVAPEVMSFFPSLLFC